MNSKRWLALFLATVVLLGAALSVAGYLLQTFFANPIAGPFVMGISSGAKLAVALTMVVFLNRGMLTSSVTLIVAALRVPWPPWPLCWRWRGGCSA